jgi:hypothetical protein
MIDQTSADIKRGQKGKGEIMVEEKNGGAVLPLGGEIVQIGTVEDIISIAQRRDGVFDKLMEMALKRTNSRDWMSVENQPYLVHSGAEKVARRFGIKIHNVAQKKDWSEDSKGRFYIYITTGIAALPGSYDSIEAMGTCSQRDKFFGFSNGSWKDTVEIDETNIMKASYSNFVVNAITHLLGLRNMTWEDLKGAGIDTAKIQKIEYEKGSGKKDLSEEGKSTRTKLGNMLLQMANNDKDAAGKLLEKYSFWESTEEKEGKKVKVPHKASSLTNMTEKWINTTYGRAKEDFDKVAGGPQGREPGQEG